MIKNALHLVLAWVALLAIAGSVVYLYSQFHSSPPLAVPQSYRSIQYLHDPAMDPQIGETVDLPRTDIFGRKIARFESDVLLVYAGSCQSCALRSITPDSLDLSAYSAVVVIINDDESTIVNFYKEPVDSFLVASDQSTILREFRSPSWEPRFYLLSKDLALKNIQMSNWAVSEFVRLI
jgi:hypothetical protein